MLKNNNMIKISLFTTVLFFGYANQLFAAGSRFLCGNERIREGDTMHEIRLDCGEPDSEMRIGEKTLSHRHTHEHVKEVRYVTEWIYDKGNFIYILTFEGSTLTDTAASRR